MQFTISDAVATRPLPDFTICGNCYAVISKDTSMLKSARIISENVILIEMNLPILNNDWDRVVLKNAQGITIDSLYYDIRWGTKGKSLERISSELPATISENLKASIDPSGATCGYRNSIAPYKRDIALEFSAVDYSNSSLTLRVINKGEEIADNVNIDIYIVTNNENKLYNNFTVNSLHHSQVHIHNIDLEDLYAKAPELNNIKLYAYSDFKDDENSNNDTATAFINKPLTRSTILINEIMYDMSQGRAEYIELYNTTNSNIILHNWVIANRGSDFNKGGIVINNPDFVINAKSYCVIAWDSVIVQNFPYLGEYENLYIKKQSFNLRQTSDEIVIYDSDGIIQDSMSYFNTWHSSIFKITKDISLEKINPYYDSNSPQSWASSSDDAGGTPGKANSIFSDTDTDEILNCSPNPFSPTGSGKERICTINYNLQYSLAVVNVYIFDMAGTKVKELASGLFTSGSSSLTWDGTNNDGSILPAGAYILYLDASCADTKKTTNSKILVVIGSK